MKTMTKRLLAVMLSVMLVMGALPFMPITAMADAESDLEDAIAYFEEHYIEPLATDGYDALYTNMSSAYADYLAAIASHDAGTASEMSMATKKLTRHWTGEDYSVSPMQVYADKMEPFTAPTANGDVKIGNGSCKDASGATVTSQPAATDYNKIIYSDGESNTGWLTNNNRAEIYGTYGLWDYQNYYDFYYPNTVVLVDGKGEGEAKYPLIPVVLGITSNGGNSATIPEFCYEATEGVDLTDNWYGTIEGNAGTSSSLTYTKPTWPNMAVSSSYNVEEYNYGIEEISIQNGRQPNPFNDPWYSTNTSGRWQIYKNHFRYTVVDNLTASTNTIAETYWMGAGGFKWLNLASGTRAFDPIYADGTSIYAINYVLLTDELTAFFAEKGADFSVEMAQKGGFSTYFAALDQATSLDPTDLTTYQYANAAYSYNGYTGMEAAVHKCGDDIDAAIEGLKTATLDDTDSQMEAVEELIAVYEAKMYAGHVYTNMTDAYNWYRKACQYRDAVRYGDADPETDLDPTFQEVLVQFNKAIGAMQIVEAGAYNAISEEVFDGDSSSDTKTQAYKDTFSNLVNVQQAPARNRNENSSDTNGDRVQRMNDSYTTTYMYVPKAVGVYDGTNDTADHYPFSIPILLGFTSTGGSIFGDDDRYLRNYYSRDTKLQFAYDWKTRTFVPGDEDIYINMDSGDWNKEVFNIPVMVGTSKTEKTQLWQYVKDALAGDTSKTIPTLTYIENPSLNQILNFDNSLTDTANQCFYSTNNNSSSYQSNRRSDHGGNTDDPENFYANVLKIQNPYTTNLETDNNFKKYYYKYASWNTGMRGSSGSKTGTYSKMEVYIINYKPVQDVITANEGFLTDKSDGGKNQLEKIGFENLTEGRILDYFQDMDKLTSCYPGNPKYEYNNDSYVNSIPDGTSGKTANITGRYAAVEQCAYDIWTLLESGTDEAIQLLDDDGLTQQEIDDFKDVKNADADHSTAGEDGNYYSIKDAIEADPNEVGECASGRYWDAYVAKLNAAKAAMVEVASQGYKDSFSKTITYIDPTSGQETSETFTSVAEVTDSLKAAYNLLGNAPKNRHTIRFDHRVDPTGSDRLQYDTGVFVCTVNDEHTALYPLEDYDEDGHIIPGKEEDNTADLGVYDALSFAYTTIDFNRYENDYIMETAKAEFDKLLDDGTGVGEEVVESTETGAEMDPQIFVDQKVSEMLTAINKANSDDYTVYYHPMFYVVDADGEEHDVTDDFWHNIDNGQGARGVRYGESVDFTIPDEFEGDVYKWEFYTYDSQGNPVISNRLVDAAVEGDADKLRSYLVQFTGDMATDLYVTAYIKRANTDDSKAVVKLLNPYNKAVTEFVANKTDSVSLVDGALHIGDETYELTDAYNIPKYDVTGFKLKDGATTVADYLNEEGTEAKIGVDFEKDETTTFNFTMNGSPISGTYHLDDLVEIHSQVDVPAADAFDPFVAIAIDLGANYASTGAKFRYLPISYTRNFALYAVTDLDFVDITCNEAMNVFYANGVQISLGTSGDDSYYRFAIERKKTKMPFVWAKFAPATTLDNGKTEHLVYSYYTNIENLEAGNDQAATFVEAGTVFASSNLDRDNFKEGMPGVHTVVANKRVLDSYYSVRVTSNTEHIYARSYVKYKYSFVPARDEDDDEVQPVEIEAIIYGDVVND